MAEGQADERAAGMRIRMRAPLARSGTAGTARRRCPPAPRRPRRRASPNPAPGAMASRNQRRLPAAESITDMRCQRPGTAWQNAWTRPRGLVRAAASVAANTTPDVPSDSATVPGDDRPDADGVGRLVAAARHDRGAGPEARRRGRGRASRRPSPRALERRRHPCRVDPERLEHHRRPVARREVEQLRPRAVRLVHRVARRSARGGRSPWAAGRGRPGPRRPARGRAPRRAWAP